MLVPKVTCINWKEKKKKETEEKKTRQNKNGMLGRKYGKETQSKEEYRSQEILRNLVEDNEGILCFIFQLNI